MYQKRIFTISLIVLVLVSVIFAGCTSQSQEKATLATQETAHPERTMVPVETISSPGPTSIPESAGSAVAQILNTTPKVHELMVAGDGISLSYPDRFKPISNTSLEKMRIIAEQGGIHILTILTATDSKDSVQVTRQDANATTEEMYAEKMAISREVALNGSVNVISMTFVRYVVEKLTLPDGTGVVKITAENTDKGTAVTYLFCKPGMVYNVNFVYDSPERAESQSSVRDAILPTIHLE
ncbi:MAG: hypothetical protein LUQ50_05235 [Methanospirillum sp.]|uniref:hypothetical protein n=1 Tax=Methanospirillum sp. TaxID=45200 RepID=UPI00236F2BB2|nr:hypothetical protein [Methanospirillum sp.]MDD1728456.1 hypothetical protein [Methanospirillum sp.]